MYMYFFHFYDHFQFCYCGNQCQGQGMRDLEYERLAKLKAWSAHSECNLTKCSPATLRMPTMRMASAGTGTLLMGGSMKAQGLEGGVSHVWEATESCVSNRDWSSKAQRVITNQTVYYSHLIWPVCWSAAVYLEVWLVEYVWQLCGGVAAVCEGAQLSQDVLHQLHIIVPHGLQSCLLQTLCTLENQSGFGSHIHHQLLVFHEKMPILLHFITSTGLFLTLFIFRYI